MASLVAMLFTACDPITQDDPGMDANITSEELLSRVLMVQKSEGNNNFTYTTDKSLPVQVCSADGSILAYGTKGSFQLVPGANPTLTYKYINHDGSVVTAEKTFTVTEYTDLPEIYAKIFGDDYGTTTWVWDTDLSRYWGNGGWESDSGPSWWGAPDYTSIDEQATGKGLTAEGDGANAWFSLSFTGVKTSRGETGSVKVTTSVAKDGWDIGTMTFTGTIPPMGILPNDGNQRCYTYQIIKADGTHLVLCAHSLSNSGEGWFLCFKKK